MAACENSVAKMLSVSNITNRRDPNSLKSRVFVGNLNTVQMSKTELESVFSKYGAIVGISIHKGYAFIQYANEINARAAVISEDSKTYYNMILDVTIASEPKNRKRLRSNISRNASNWNALTSSAMSEVVLQGQNLSTLAASGGVGNNPILSSLQQQLALKGIMGQPNLLNFAAAASSVLSNTSIAAAASNLNSGGSNNNHNHNTTNTTFSAINNIINSNSNISNNNNNNNNNSIRKKYTRSSNIVSNTCAIPSVPMSLSAKRTRLDGITSGSSSVHLNSINGNNTSSSPSYISGTLPIGARSQNLVSLVCPTDSPNATATTRSKSHFPNIVSNSSNANTIRNKLYSHQKTEANQLNANSNQPQNHRQLREQSNLSSRLFHSSSTSSTTRSDSNSESKSSHLSNHHHSSHFLRSPKSVSQNIKSEHGCNSITTAEPRGTTSTNQLNQNRKTNFYSAASVEDILICGSCRRLFEQLDELIAHKMAGCSLDKESDGSSCSCRAVGEPDSLECAYCGANFSTAWGLMHHCHIEHGLTIYTLSSSQSTSPRVSLNSALSPNSIDSQHYSDHLDNRSNSENMNHCRDENGDDVEQEEDDDDNNSNCSHSSNSSSSSTRTSCNGSANLRVEGPLSGLHPVDTIAGHDPQHQPDWELLDPDQTPPGSHSTHSSSVQHRDNDQNSMHSESHYSANDDGDDDDDDVNDCKKEVEFAVERDCNNDFKIKSEPLSPSNNIRRGRRGSEYGRHETLDDDDDDDEDDVNVVGGGDYNLNDDVIKSQGHADISLKSEPHRC